MLYKKCSIYNYATVSLYSDHLARNTHTPCNREHRSYPYRTCAHSAMTVPQILTETNKQPGRPSSRHRRVPARSLKAPPNREASTCCLIPFVRAADPLTHRRKHLHARKSHTCSVLQHVHTIIWSRWVFPTHSHVRIPPSVNRQTEHTHTHTHELLGSHRSAAAGPVRRCHLIMGERIVMCMRACVCCAVVNAYFFAAVAGCWLHFVTLGPRWSCRPDVDGNCTDTRSCTRSCAHVRMPHLSSPFVSWENVGFSRFLCVFVCLFICRQTNWPTVVDFVRSSSFVVVAQRDGFEKGLSDTNRARGLQP